MSTLPFVKMHGLGNDYVYFDCFQAATAEIMAKTDLSALARRVSDRHFGIGSDGLVLILPAEEADARMRMFNADGSEAQMCGNAIRCVGKYLYESGICAKPELRIVTLSGLKTLSLHIDNGAVESVTVNMGIPEIRPDTFSLDGTALDFMFVNMGNPHAVFFRDTPVSTEELHTLGPKIETHPHFPEGTNVEFACVRNEREIDMRVWERGTGETMACGTGTCATAVAAIQQGKVAHTVTVHLLGGDLVIRWDGDRQPVFMTGPAAEAFRGTIKWNDYEYQHEFSAAQE